MSDHRCHPRVRLLDTARVLVLVALRADPRGVTAGDLYRRIQAHCARSSVYAAIAELALERFLTSGPVTLASVQTRLAALAPDVDPARRHEATLQLTPTGAALAQELQEALQAIGLRAFAGAQETTWPRRVWASFGAANRLEQARIVVEQGYPQADLPRSLRQRLLARYRTLRDAAAAGS